VGVVPDRKGTKGRTRYLLHRTRHGTQNAKIQNENQNGRHPVPKWKSLRVAVGVAVGVVVSPQKTFLAGFFRTQSVRIVRKNRTYDFAWSFGATLSCYDCMTIGTADFAFAYFGFDYFEGVTAENHVGDVVLFVGEVVELEDAVVGCTAVCAFTIEAFVSVYECFVAIALVAVLVDTSLLI